MPFTVITGVNTLFNALLNAPGIGEINARALKLAVGGGMAVQRAVAERWQEMFGVPLIEGYGLTETSPIVCANPLDSKEYTGQHRAAAAFHEVSIRDDDGQELPLGEVGRDLRARAAGDERLLEQARGDGQGVHRRRLAAHRRHGLHGRARLRQAGGPQEGHDRGVRLQGVPQRSRGRGA